MLERLPETARVGLCRALQPLVFPVHDFVDRWYHTEPRLRLARIRGSILWWHLRGDEETDGAGKTYPTAEALIEQIDGYADYEKPLPPFRAGVGDEKETKP